MSSDMKQEMNRLGSDLGEVKTIVRNIAVEVSKLTEKMDTSLQRMATMDEMKKDLGSIKGQLDDFTADIQASRRERSLQDESFNFLKDMLGDHERRLSKLEPPENKS